MRLWGLWKEEGWKRGYNKSYPQKWVPRSTRLRLTLAILGNCIHAILIHIQCSDNPIITYISASTPLHNNPHCESRRGGHINRALELDASLKTVIGRVWLLIVFIVQCPAPMIEIKRADWYSYSARGTSVYAFWTFHVFNCDSVMSWCRDVVMLWWLTSELGTEIPRRLVQ